MKKIAMWQNAAVAAACVCLAAGCKTPKALSSGLMAAGVATGAAALQAGLSAPYKDEKAAKENPSWVAVAETLTPAQKKAVLARLHDDPWRAWKHWEQYKSVKSGDYTPEVHAEVLRVCEEVRQTKVQPCFQWNPPDLEKRWERRLAEAEVLSTAPRTEGADAARGEALLEKFASSRMPKSFARYRAARQKAVELERVLKNDFPQGKESDPSGGEIYERTRKNAARAIGEMFRRHDELCFFFLMRKGGIFSDDALKKQDDRGGAVWLEGPSATAAGKAPGNLPALGEEDAAFAREHLPESWQTVQALLPLYQTGAVQYRELRKLALALDAGHAEGTLALFLNRLAAMEDALGETYRQFGVFRFRNRIGELDGAALGAEDRETASSLHALREEVALGRWVSRKAKMGVLQLPGGETMDMVWCPPGTFQAGSPETEKGRGTNEVLREVTIAKGFWMAKFEVTTAQFLCALTHGTKEEAEGAAMVAGMGETKAKTPKAGELAGARMKDFLAVSLLELPTPEEWEYACRAGSTGPYGGTGNLDEMGWYAANSGGAIHPVGGKLPNAWGLCDMHGNVWERCAGEDTPIRGGSIRDRAADCRAAFHDSLDQRLQNKVEGDLRTMLRRLREEGIDEVDLQRDYELLPPWKREKLRRLMEEGVIVNPASVGNSVMNNVGFRPVFRP
ncbi:MAG: SUMF1/EgtB/PvdO family nonheme iron enzyme [Kiritimatiellae bacterium]|nr:SUMF1/EgtB/PvdO family nonheme iron enzyme [Kiritimatiellia bacterium]